MSRLMLNHQITIFNLSVIRSMPPKNVELIFWDFWDIWDIWTWVSPELRVPSFEITRRPLKGKSMLEFDESKEWELEFRAILSWYQVNIKITIKKSQRLNKEKEKERALSRKERDANAISKRSSIIGLSDTISTEAAILKGGWPTINISLLDIPFWCLRVLPFLDL